MLNGNGTDTTMLVSPAFNSGNGWFGGGDGLASIIWVVVIIAVFGGLFNGNGWFGGGNMNNALTRGELCQDMNFSDLSNAVGRLQQSVSDGFATQNMNFVDRVDNLSNQIATGFDAVNLALVRDGYETRNNAIQNFNSLNTSIMNGFCNVQNGFAQASYQQATDTCAITTAIKDAARDIIDNNNSNTRSLYDYQVNTRMAQLENENQTLRLAASQAKQNNYLIDELRPPVRPAYLAPNPYAYTYGYNGCCGNAA